MDKITFARVAVTGICFLCFLALTYWAFSRRNSHMMEELGRSVIEQEDHLGTEDDHNNRMSTMDVKRS